MINKILYIAVTYPIGIMLGIFFVFLRLAGVIKVKFPERIPENPEKIIVAHNHPSYFLDPLFAASIFFPHYLRRPFKFAPWSTPDKKNFYNRWFMFWLRTRAIPINRGSEEGKKEAFEKMIKVLNAGGILVMSPEGGRTSTGGNEFMESKSGQRIRKNLKQGIGFLVLKTNAKVLPVWFEGTDQVWPNDKKFAFRFWKTITIKIGEPIGAPLLADKKTAALITSLIGEKILNLADE